MRNSLYLIHTIFYLDFWLRNSKSAYRYLVPIARQKATNCDLCSSYWYSQWKDDDYEPLGKRHQLDSEDVAIWTQFHLFCYKCTLWNFQFSHNLNTRIGKTVKRLFYYYLRKKHFIHWHYLRTCSCHAQHINKKRSLKIKRWYVN